MATYLPGAMELADSIRELAMDGHPVFTSVTVSDVRMISTGGCIIPPRVTTQNGNIVIALYTTSLSQRIIATPASSFPKNVALEMIAELLRRSP